ncbi:MAG: DUF5060 domain-containing protein [Gammaproteobacteria bacterium]
MWYPLTIDFNGPEANETDDSPNPFLDYRLVVTLQRPDGTTFTVPGFFDGNGNGAGEGTVWRVRFAPDQPGVWNYTASFREGDNVAIELGANAGNATSFDGETGQVDVQPRDPNAPGFLSEGVLEYVGGHYLKFRDGDFWIKGGVDSPENFLGYDGFDNTVAPGFKHRYPTHVADWNNGDPNFTSADSGYDGRAIIGALNYLASENVNSIYFLPMNLGGDGKDTYPFTGFSGSSFDNTHYDISKLAQWTTVLDHAQRKGIAVNIVLNETESANENWLDNGQLGTQRRLFYRELAARFNFLLAKKWNMCEENDYDVPLLNSFVDYLAAQDPSDAAITVHTNRDGFNDYNQIVGDARYSATSIQYSPDQAGSHVENWRTNSANAGQPWVLDMDENAPANTGLNSGNAVDLRKRVLWDVLLSGGNIEWYFGGNGQPEGGDQNTEDFRSREQMYRYMWFARRFMQEELPFNDMLPDDNLVNGEDSDFGGAQVFAKAGTHYAVYLPNASGNPTIDLNDVAGSVTRRWFNPQSGEFEGSAATLSADAVISIGTPPSRTNEDWVVLFTAADTETDTDSDGVADSRDNCTLISNAGQRDTNGDGFGNACDPDLDGDGVVNAVDLGLLRAVFFSADEDADFNGDGVVNVLDLGIMRTFFFQAPGPAG